MIKKLTKDSTIRELFNFLKNGEGHIYRRLISDIDFLVGESLRESRKNPYDSSPPIYQVQIKITEKDQGNLKTALNERKVDCHVDEYHLQKMLDVLGINSNIKDTKDE